MAQRIGVAGGFPHPFRALVQGVMKVNRHDPDIIRVLREQFPEPHHLPRGFAGRHTLTDIGHVVFLDLGSDDGIRVGDEFVLYGEAIPTASEGHLQVIGVKETVSSARVMSMRDNVFNQGVVVRLARKMN